MSDPIAANAAELADTLTELEQADAQAVAWNAERERLIRKAKSLGGTHRGIAARTSFSHPGVGKLIKRGTEAAPDPGNVV